MCLVELFWLSDAFEFAFDRPGLTLTIGDDSKNDYIPLVPCSYL